MRRTLIPLSLFLIAALIPAALCRLPPPPDEWPLEKYTPIDPSAIMPGYKEIWPYGGKHDLLPDTPFYLHFAWYLVQANEVYDWKEKTVEPAYMNLMDRTDNAYAHYSITLDGQPLQPNCLTGMVEWHVFWNSPEPRQEFPNGDHWAVARRCMFQEYWVDFPKGLPGRPEDYTVVLRIDPSGGAQNVEGGEPREWTTILHVHVPPLPP